MPVTHREAHFSTKKYKELQELPESIPKVDEVGCTSAPLESVGFQLGMFCKKYNDDFILCKNESTNPADCLKEGRRVTRCAADFISKLKANCQSEWQAHYQCLENSNHHLWQCREQERPLNKCIFDSTVSSFFF